MAQPKSARLVRYIEVDENMLWGYDAPKCTRFGGTDHGKGVQMCDDFNKKGKALCQNLKNEL
jgi:hypothetical protein